MAVSPRRADAVLLDALGTLLELRPPWPALARLLRERHGLEISQARAREALLAEMAHYRRHNHEAADPAALAALRLSCADVLRAGLGDAARAVPRADLLATLLDALVFVPFPDVVPALGALRGAGRRLAVVSNWDISLHEVLAASGLRELVDAVVTSAEAGAAKPDPAIFGVALEAVGVAADAAVHVGDSREHDVAGARAAGIRAVLLERDRTLPVDDDRDVDGDEPEVIGSLAQLPGLLG